MNTPAHLIFAAAAFGKPNYKIVTFAALLGGLAPDLSLYLMAGVSLFVLQIPADHVFGVLYFSPAWQHIFAIDNSFVLWGAALALAIYRKSAWGIALTGAALLHLAFDFPFHTDDARSHFWPLTDWKFHSPISYWDPAAGGTVVTAIELLLVIGATAYLLYRFTSPLARLGFVALCALQVLPTVAWYFMAASGQ